LTFVGLCIDHGRGDVFQSHVTFLNLYYCTPKYVPRTIFLRTNKFSQIFLMIVILGVILKRNY